MDEIKQSPAKAPGAVAEPIVPSIGTITDYLQKDLSVAISCLEALRSDQDLLNHMAQFMHGRFVNALEAKNRQPMEK